MKNQGRWIQEEKLIQKERDRIRKLARQQKALRTGRKA